jgi:hypothetical protein
MALRRRLITLLLALLGVAVTLLVIDGDPSGALRGYVRAESDGLKSYDLAGLDEDAFGAVYFTHGDFSALSSDTLRVSATPWVLTAALLALAETGGDPTKVTLASVSEAFQRFGFHASAHVENWPEGLPQPALKTPFGLNTGTASRLLPPVAVTIANIGCPACHSGVLYQADGKPDISRAWIGAPNTSINLEGYTIALYGAMRDHSGNEVVLWAAIDRLFPDLSLRERQTLKLIVLPALRSRLVVLEAEFGRAIPFSGGLPGATNGLDSLKSRLGMIPEGAVIKDSAFNSVPDLGGRLSRAALLNTSSYTIPGRAPDQVIATDAIDSDHIRKLAGMVAFFTVPSMGVTPEAAAENIDNTDRVMNWLRTYRPQPYPKAIDGDSARRGQSIYAAQCATCHGTYSNDPDAPRLLSFPNWLGDIGTDPLRKDLFDDAVAQNLNATLVGKYIRVVPGQGYAAPPLTGIWSSAPYFHNGSVPTLWHLMHPADRPAAFQVGGHALDLDLVGIAGRKSADGAWLYAGDYTPWSDPVLVDTAKPGLGNRGHEAPFDSMPEADKQDLIEYLKLL